MFRLLLIEDDDFQRDSLADLLEDAGYHVEVARDGREGVILYSAFRPDCVITDLVMPEQEGLETIQKLKALNVDVRIIAISGSAVTGTGYVMKTDMALDAAEDLGASYVFPKPVEIDELLKAIDVICSDT